MMAITRPILFLVCFCLLVVSATAQPFSKTTTAGGGDHHDFVIDGVRYRIRPDDSSISVVEKATVSGKLPFQPSLDWIHGYLWRDQLLLFYGQRSGAQPLKNSGILVSLDSRTLNPKWHLETTDYTETLFVEGGALYVAMDDTVEKVDLSTGKRLWTRAVPYDGGWGEPRIDGKRLMFSSTGFSSQSRMKATFTGTLALDKMTGEVLEVQGCVYEPDLFVHSLSRVDKETGQWTFWCVLNIDYVSFTPEGALARWDFGRGVAAAQTTLPLAKGERITSGYAGAHGSQLWMCYRTNGDNVHLVGFEKATLHQLWHHSVPCKRVYRPGNLGTESIFLELNQGMQSIDASTGKVLWSVELPVSPDGSSELVALSTPILQSGRLVLKENTRDLNRADGELVPLIEAGYLVLDPKSGEILERKPSVFQRAISH